MRFFGGSKCVNMCQLWCCHLTLVPRALRRVFFPARVRAGGLTCPNFALASRARFFVLHLSPFVPFRGPAASAVANVKTGRISPVPGASRSAGIRLGGPTSISGGKENVAVVVQLIRRRGPEEHVLRLFVQDIPADLDRTWFKKLLARAGYGFGELGVLWANQYVVRLSKADPNVQAAWEEARVPRVMYTELVAMAERQGVIFLRVPGLLKARLTAMADQHNVSLNELCARTLAEAAR